MIAIRQLFQAIHPYSEGQGYLLIFSFHCDVSYDGSSDGNVKGIAHDPTTYVFGGFLSSPITWAEIEHSWQATNSLYHVPQYHAAHLNRKTYEYEGWDDAKKIEYSATLLSHIHKHGKRMYAVTVGMFADEYRRIISEDGRRKMGSPYLACFNSCIARVARMMDEPGPGNILPEDKFSVLIDTDEGYLDAVRSFYQMKDNTTFQYRHRLGTCTPGKMEEIPALQPADMVAYEAFKRLHVQRKTKKEIRHVLKVLMSENVVNECYFGTKTLEQLKEKIEATPTGDGQLIIIPEN